MAAVVVDAIEAAQMQVGARVFINTYTRDLLGNVCAKIQLMRIPGHLITAQDFVYLEGCARQPVIIDDHPSVLYDIENAIGDMMVMSFNWSLRANGYAPGVR